MPRRGNLLAFLILTAIVVATGIAVFATRKLTMEIQETERAKLRFVGSTRTSRRKWPSVRRNWLEPWKR